MSLSIMRLELGIDISPDLNEAEKNWLGQQLAGHVKDCVDAIQEKRRLHPNEVDWASIPPLGEA